MSRNTVEEEAGGNATVAVRTDEPEHETIFPLEEEYQDMPPMPELVAQTRKPVAAVDGSARDIPPLDHFLRVAFQGRVEQFALMQSGTGFDAPPGRMIRWEERAITYAVENAAEPEAAEIVEDAVGELSKIMDERGIKLVRSEHIPDIAIHITEAAVADDLTGQTTVLADHSTGIIRRAEVHLFGDTITPAAALRHLMLALGLQGWAEPGADSVLWFPVDGVTPSDRTTPSPIDTEALLLLYHPSLSPGMTMEQALASLDENAPEVDVPDVPGVTAPAYEPRIRPDLREEDRRRRGESM